MNIHQIAFQNRGKVKKTEAARLILELAEQFPAAIPKLGLLLALHQPPAQKADSLFAWVAKAAAAKDGRKYLQFVMCDGTTMVATDGTVLHAAPCTDKAPGLYDPKTGQRVWLLECNYAQGETPAGHPGRWPDWRRIVPRPGARSMRDADPAQLGHLAMGKDPAVQGPNRTTIKQAQWSAATLRCTRVCWGEKPHVDSVYFEGPNGEQAVVMPFRETFVAKAGGAV